jgi:hypothetical protein
MVTTVNLPTGTDGGVPMLGSSINSGFFGIWSLYQIYQGAAGTNMVIPSVNDYVVDNQGSNTWYRVTAVDPTTRIPTLVALTTAPNAVMTTGDLLQGVGPGTQADTFRVYLDQSVIPFELGVDQALYFPGPDVASIKIFTGSDFTNNNNCISALYNQNGTLLSQAIPTVAVDVTYPDGSVGQAMTVPVCYSNVSLPDGTAVTLIAYSTTGSVVSKRQLLIENTAFIRSADTSVKYVTGIALECAFLSQTNPNLIQFPINVLTSGLNLMGVVSYSDGSSSKLPVDGTKFQILGFDTFVSSVVGQQFNVILKYNLSSDEAVYGANSVNNQLFITETYTAQTINNDGAYTLKLYAYPVWINSVSGYRLEWFLYDLDRSQFWDVTSLVTFSSTSAAFQPLNYGTLQTITAELQLNDVENTFTDYIFTQSLNITLLQPGTNASPWEVQFTPGQQPPYGPGNLAAVQELAANQWTINLAAAYTTQAAWLAAMYTNTQPLTNPQTEASLPQPNYFAIQLPDGSSIECPISQWNSTQTSTVSLANTTTLFVTFFLRTSSNDLQLSVAGVPVQITNMTNGPT